MSEHYRESYYGSSPSDLRLILLGNIGCGKTSSADTILGQLSAISPNAARSCQLRQGFTEGKNVTLVEAPRWYWNGGKMEDNVKQETERAVTLVAPGPHAILLLVPVSQFTEMEGRVPAALAEVFGEEALDHTLVLLTCGDYLMGRTVEEYLRNEHPGLRQMIECCGGRYHVINNRQRQDREQVQELLNKVDNMVQKNGVYYMKTAQERDLEKRVKDRKRELMESYQAQKEEKRKTFVSTSIPNTEMLDRGEESISYLESKRRREEREEMERRREEREEMERRREEREEMERRREEMERREEREAMERRREEMERRREEREEMERREEREAIERRREEMERREEREAIERRREEIERRRREREQMEGRVNVSQVSNGLHSTPAPEQQSYSESRDIRQANRTPSFRLNAEGAILSQIHEVKSTPKKISTFHHRINSFEERSPEASPTSLHSSIFSSSAAHSSPTSAASPSVLSSSTSSPSYYSSYSSSSPSYSSSSSSSPELRLVLLGRSGSGKSAAGNAILGQKDFESCPDSLIAITQECEKKKALVEGRRVAVVDTPDWFNSECAPEEVRAQISSCVALSSPGPHAFLMCVPVDQPAKTELQALRALENVFGPEAVQKYTMLLFTYADRLRESGKAGNDSVETYIASQRGDLLKLVEKCGDRFHVMETGRGVRERRNVAELLEKVERTVKEAGGQCYSSPAFQEAENKVRQKQVEIARERRGIKMEQERADVGQLSSERRVLYSHMQPVAKAEEEVRQDEIEKTRDEAEMSVKTMNIESLPPITLSTLSPSLLQSIMERMGSSAKMVPKLLADCSVWVGEGAKKMKNSPVWGQVGSGAQNVQKMVVDSSVWGKVGATAGQVSKAVGDRVPKVVVDGSAWVGSGVKAAAASPMWEKVGSGAKSGARLMADGSKRVGVGIGAGAKNLAQSPMWGKVGSRAKTGAKLMAENSVRVGAGIGAGAKKVAQSPVWGKVGSGAKAGAKMVAESSVWEKIGTTAKQVPKVVIGGALLGLVLGVFLGGVIGGAVGAAAGSAVTEVGRRKFGNKDTSEKTDEAARNVERALNSSVDAVVKQGEKVLKTE